MPQSFGDTRRFSGEVSMSNTTVVTVYAAENADVAMLNAAEPVFFDELTKMVV